MPNTFCLKAGAIRRRQGCEMKTLSELQETTHASMRRDDKIKRFLTNKILLSVFAAVVILIAAVSVVTLISENKNNEPTDTEPLSLAAAVREVDSSAPQELKANFLLAVCSEEKRTVRLLACLSADSEKGNFEISYIPATQRCEVGSTEGSIEEHFKRSGSDGLIWAVRSCTGNAVDRYVIVDEKNVTDIFKVFGEQVLDIPHEVRHTYNGISFIINEGEQKITADNLAKYFSYLCDSGTEEKENITGLISRYLSLSLGGSDAEQLQKKYASLVNLIKTDISAMDITSYGQLLSSFVK